MIKIVVEAKQASLKKRKLNIIDEDHEESESVEETQSIFGSNGKERVGRGRGSLSYHKSNDEKCYKEEVDAQFVDFFFT